MSWKRPENIPYPNVWARFEGKILIDGKPLKYTIQDITEDLFEPILDHMFRYYTVREPLLSHDGFQEDEEAKKELRDVWRKTLGQRMAIVAFAEGGGLPKRIAGCNIIYVTTKSDPPFQFKSKILTRFITIIYDFYNKENLFEKYGTDYYLNALGLSVAPQYQGDSLGYHLLQARTPLCQAFGIPLTVTIFTNPAASYSALKAGFHKTQEETLDKYKNNGEKMYPRSKAPVVLTAKIIPAAK